MEPLRAGDPERVGGFVLRGRLGAGGMGEVFLGRSPGGRSVAVKVVYPHLAGQREFRARFVREVAAAEAVSGMFTAPVVAAGPEDDRPWVATAYIPGPDLALAIAETGPLPGFVHFKWQRFSIGLGGGGPSSASLMFTRSDVTGDSVVRCWRA
ncbi:hypothetical protein SAMN06297387_108220 [Streptomyces zhaozhouensis]|uniref:Protein kinase domain-containing protein n=1 Tax=Streptomyces zhaozhouensis TaxID=1300267 RepID=A0A286DWJ8_9ACTN|nr:hypothetical protein SAMN06297387_108220 [Streptomyces zhaozhouensis]